jgi:hypothetical protein
VKRSLWLVLLVLGVTACGGATTATTTATTAPTTTAAAAVEAAETDLSGLGFEVHQAPG